jgi:Uma2 family endonuclease
VEEPIRAKMHFSDYLELPDDGKRYEVLEGTLMMSPAPGFRHQRVSSNLHFSLETWCRARAPEGQVLAAPFDVVLADDTIVQPDLIYVRPERAGLIVAERLHGAPDLVVEIFHAAGASRDRVAKLQVYSRFQIPEYWLVDIDARTLTMLALFNRDYTPFASGTGDAPLRSRVLDGLDIRPSEVFARI